jgi:hypothetical protein
MEEGELLFCPLVSPTLSSVVLEQDTCANAFVFVDLLKHAQTCTCARAHTCTDTHACWNSKIESIDVCIWRHAQTLASLTSRARIRFEIADFEGGGG